MGATDGDRPLLDSDCIDDVSSIIVKKIVEPASRTYARELHAKWKEFYLSDPATHASPFSGFSVASHLQAMDEPEKASLVAAAAAPGTRAPPRLRKQKSMMTERKDHAREDMEETTGAHLDTQEVTSLKQVLSWCTLQLQKKDHHAKAFREETKPVDAADVPDGMVALPQKAKDEFLVAPKAKHKSHKHHKSKKPVAHDAMSIKLFASLNLEIPSTPEDCDKIIHDVRARLAAHQTKDDQQHKEEVDYWRRRLEGGHDDEEGHACHAGSSVWTWGPTY